MLELWQVLLLGFHSFPPIIVAVTVVLICDEHVTTSEKTVEKLAYFSTFTAEKDLGYKT